MRLAKVCRFLQGTRLISSQYFRASNECKEVSCLKIAAFLQNWSRGRLLFSWGWRYWIKLNGSLLVFSSPAVLLRVNELWVYISLLSNTSTLSLWGITGLCLFIQCLKRWDYLKASQIIQYSYSEDTHFSQGDYLHLKERLFYSD